MNNFYILFATIVVLGCTGTQNNSVHQPDDENQIPTGHTSQNSLDWEGTYRGILPCADCDGIEATITLTKDLTFKQKYRHAGKGDALESSGTFSWSKTGKSISLTPAGAADTSQYFVGENSLAQLDSQGNKVGGNDAAKHILTKANYDILEKYWKLIELNGKPVTIDSTSIKEAYIIFKEADNRITGNGGCNTIGGAYIIRGQNSLSISNLFSTKMFCQQMEMETQFLTVIQTAKSFNLHGDSLSIHNAQSPAAAKFVAVYMK